MQHDDDSEEDDDDDDDDDDGLDEDIFKKKGSKKKDRKSMWKPEEVDDLVDVIISKEYYKKNLIFTNTKNQKMGKFMPTLPKNCKKGQLQEGSHFYLWQNNCAQNLKTSYQFAKRLP